MSKLKTFQNLVFEDFQILVTIDDFSNYGKTKEFDFLNILVRNDVFSNFGKKWRFFKNQPKLKIFHNFVVIDDFSNFGKIWRFFKIWYNQRNVIFCKNRWFLKFWQKMKIFQILVKIEDFWKLEKCLNWKKRGSYAGIWIPQSYGHPSKYWWGSMLLNFRANKLFGKCESNNL